MLNNLKYLITIQPKKTWILVGAIVGFVVISSAGTFAFYGYSNSKKSDKTPAVAGAEESKKTNNTSSSGSGKTTSTGASSTNSSNNSKNTTTTSSGSSSTSTGTGTSSSAGTSATNGAGSSGTAPVVGISVKDFGAKGDGVTDDTVALQKAFDSIKSGDTLIIPTGSVFKHSDVLRIGVAGVTITGGGTILATNEQRSALYINANNVTLDGGLIIKMNSTTKRWDAYEQMKIRVGPQTGVVIKNITVDGSAAAGIYVGGASNFVISDVTVQNTRADGIHMTEASHDGQVLRPIVKNTGDDGVAVVSYSSNATPCKNITIQSPKMYNQVWGRAFSVVGGQDITYNDIYAEYSNAASIYVAAESEWGTHANARITFNGGTIKYGNQNAAVDHGAIIIYNSLASSANTDITIKNISIYDTRLSASDQVRVISYSSSPDQRLAFENIAITRGGSSLFFSNLPASSTKRTGWTYNGVAQANQIGW